MPTKRTSPKKIPRRKLKSMSSPLLNRIKKKFPAKSIKKANRTRKRSSLELIVYKWLQEEEIVFRKEKVVGKCHVDIFLEPNIALEIQGCYFHRCKKCFPDKTKETLEIRMRDLKRFAFFRSKGYEVHTIWGCEIKANPEAVKEYLRSLDSRKR
jgi:G:T-mismatch repair DNA endonuclease (very short patch repair protein)